jgi:hypothetical protein
MQKFIIWHKVYQLMSKFCWIHWSFCISNKEK